MSLPAHLLYSADHEWIDVTTGTVGITAFAASSLGDIIYVLLPEPGTALTPGQPCGEVESTKSVSELYSPAAGTVIANNDAVAADPSLLNRDPYGDGWLYRLQHAETPDLMDATAYGQLVGARPA